MTKITLLGLGPGWWGHLTLEALETLEKAQRVFLRTEKHPVAAQLKARGISYISFDRFYQEGGTFEEVYARIAEVLVEEAVKGDLVYAVPGNPAAETSCYLLMELAKQRGIEVHTIPGMSFLEIAYQRLGIDPVRGCR